MSETSDPKPPESEVDEPQTESTDAVDAIESDAHEATARSEPATEPGPVKQRAGHWSAWLAWLTAIAALALALWSLWLRWNDDEIAPASALSALESRLEATENSLRQLSDLAAERVGVAEFQRLEARLRSTEQTISTQSVDPGLELRVQQIEQLDAERTRDLAAMDERLRQAEQAGTPELTRLEQRLAAFELAARSEEVASSDDRVEVERLALLRIEDLLAAGRDRLEVLGDVQTARIAWSEAITRVERLQSPAFASLLQRLRAERDALNAVSTSDRAALVSALLGAASEVGQWRVPGDEISERDAELDSGTAADRGWRDRLDQLFDRMVRVERVDIEYLDPAELDAARRSICAILETLALAVARRDDAVAARLAAVAERRVRRLFDSSEAQVAALIQRLGALANPQQIPELSLDASALELRRLVEARQ